MKRTLLFTTIALTFISVGAHQSADIALEKFLSKDLLFRDECISNLNNTDCQIIKAALLTAYKYGCSDRYLTKNTEYIENQYNQLLNQNQNISHLLATLPKMKSIHDAMITHHKSKEIFEKEETKAQLESAAIRLIIKFTAGKQPSYQSQQLELFNESMLNAFENQNQNQQEI